MFEREDEIEAIAEGIGAAVGTDDLNPSAHQRATEPSCAAALGVDEDGAWYERRTFALAAPDGGDALYDPVLRHLRSEGFDVTELVAPGDGPRALRAVRGDVALLIRFLDDGANLRITAGPCAAQLTGVPDGYETVGSPSTP